jgi:hypothetical protein
MIEPLGGVAEAILVEPRLVRAKAELPVSL